MDNQTFQSRVLDLLRQARAAEQTFVADLTDAGRNEKGTFEQWSAKDVMAHIAEWRERFAQRLAAYRRGEPLPELADTDEMNAQHYGANQAKSWDQVKAENDQAFNDLVAQVSAMSDAELLDKKPYVWSEGRPFLSSLITNSYNHISEHLMSYYVARGENERASNVMESFAKQLLAADPPQDVKAIALYNLACFYALNGRADEAIARLREALPMRPDLKEWSREDPDLASLHDLPAYQALSA